MISGLLGDRGPTTRKVAVILGGFLTACLLPAACAPRLERPRSYPEARAASLDTLLPASTDRIYRTLSASFRSGQAMEVVRFMDRFWRVAGNPGFDASEDLIRNRLLEAGFAARTDEPAGASAPPGAGTAAGPGELRDAGQHRLTSPAAPAFVWYEEYENASYGWEPLRARLAVIDQTRAAGSAQLGAPAIDSSREGDRVALCINSFSTPPDGVTAPLVYVGAGTDAADYAQLDVRGAVVLGDGDVRRLWSQAVRSHGAIGVLSTAAAKYTKPDETPDIYQWGSIPHDDTLKSFGFKVSRQVATRLKERLAAGPVAVKVEIDTRFYNRPNRSLVAEIPGRSRPQERVVMVAHVQEPGANDNASGCGTLLEVAREMLAGIRTGSLPRPERTLTFIWGDEMRASRQFLNADASRAAGVRYAFALDMTGEDTSKTGGTFLVEKQPDPSAVWTRPSDPHTEWGASEVKADTLKGNLLNDLHLAICLRRARDTGWVVRTNPYEGGSDHSVFGAAGIPAVLDWHFTDRYYHTNLDRPDKTSAAEMANVGVAVATSAMVLASAREDEALAVADLIARAADARLELEQRQSEAILKGSSDPQGALSTERAVFNAWKKWYVEALDSVLTLPVGPTGASLRARVAAASLRVMQQEWKEP